MFVILLPPAEIMFGLSILDVTDVKRALSSLRQDIPLPAGCQ
jgi:hypothetical protein